MTDTSPIAPPSETFRRILSVLEYCPNVSGAPCKQYPALLAVADEWDLLGSLKNDALSKLLEIETEMTNCPSYKALGCRNKTALSIFLDLRN